MPEFEITQKTLSEVLRKRAALAGLRMNAIVSSQQAASAAGCDLRQKTSIVSIICAG
ncbi:MAG: hypothetical protein ACYCY1_11740 [Sulfuriferula sp.]